MAVVSHFSKEEYDYLVELHDSLEADWSEILRGMKKKFRKDYTQDQLHKRLTRQSYGVGNFWTDKQEEFLVKLKHAGLDWAQIHSRFTKQFGNIRSSNALADKYKNLIASGVYEAAPGHDFTKSAIGEVRKERDTEAVELHVFAAVQPMVTKDGLMLQGDELIPNLHSVGWKSLENYVERNKAKLHILPMNAHVRALVSQPRAYDEELRRYKRNFVTDMTFNGGVVKAIEAHLNPQRINPLTGLGSLTGRPNRYMFSDEDRDGRVKDVFDKNHLSNLIVAHSKQMMQTYPTGMESLPRMIHSTGSMVSPNYIENTVGRLAAEAHTLGFLILEIRGRKFFMRQVQVNPWTGEFVSMGVRYFPDGRAVRESADSMVFGDLHAGAHAEDALTCALEKIRYFRPAHTFWHDIHDGKSYTHWDQDKMLTFLSNPDVFKSLEAEGAEGRRVLGLIHEVLEEVGAKGHIVDGSNHNKHLFQYLDKLRHSKDRINNSLASELYVLAKRGVNPLRALLDGGREDLLELAFKPFKSKYNWIEPNTDFIRQGIQFGQHGHEGVAGKRGNKYEHSVVYNKAVVGHSHAPSLFNGVWTVGTLSHLRMPYENGPLKSHHADVVAYKGGTCEMLFTIGGEWKMPNLPYDKIVN